MCNDPTVDLTIEEIRAAWVEAALDEWRKVVRDDDRGVAGDRDVIAGYFEATGWGRWLDEVTGGGYRETSRTSWCGQFSAAMGLRVGRYLGDVSVALDPGVARFVLVSTARLADRKRWAAAGVAMPTHYRKASCGLQLQRSSDGQLVEASRFVKPGVICTFKTSGRKPSLGDHIVLVTRFDEATGLIHTVEGNGRGELGDGSSGEGVVRVVRTFKDLRRVYPLGVEYFEDMEV